MLVHYRLCLCPSEPDNSEALARPINHPERDTENYFSDLRLDLGQKGLELRPGCKSRCDVAISKIWGKKIKVSIINIIVYTSTYAIYTLAGIENLQINNSKNVK